MMLIFLLCFSCSDKEATEMFEETITERRNCPKCGGKETVERRIAREPSQTRGRFWYVENCENEDCDYYGTGFVNMERDEE